MLLLKQVLLNFSVSVIFFIHFIESVFFYRDRHQQFKLNLAD